MLNTQFQNDELQVAMAHGHADIIEKLQSGQLLSTDDFYHQSDVQRIELAGIRSGVEQNQRSLDTMIPIIRSLSPMPPKNDVEPETIAHIHRAAVNDDLVLLRELLPSDETGARLEVEDKQGRTPLHSAALAGQAAATQFLCERGANVNADDKSGKRPLHLALMGGHLGAAKILVQNFQASTSKTDHDGMMPASYSDHPQLVLWLLKYEKEQTVRDENGNTALIHTATLGNVPSVQYVLQRGADVAEKNQNGSTALGEACIRGHMDVIELLLSHSASPDQRDRWGWTPFGRCIVKGDLKAVQLMLDTGRIALEDTTHTPYLHTVLAEAIRLRLWPIVKLLVSHGSDVNILDWQEYPPVSRATYWCNTTDVLQVILGAGANTRVTNKDGWTAMHEAMQHRRWDAISLLVRYGADANTRQLSGKCYPLLSFAVMNSRSELVQDLLQLTGNSRVDVEVANVDGWKPLREACHYQFTNCASMLLKRGRASPWGTVNPGCGFRHSSWTCLMEAAHRGAAEVIHLLVEYGADLENTDSAGWTALRIAVESRRDDAACALLHCGASPLSKAEDGHTPFSKASRHDMPAFYMMCRALGKG